MSRPAADLAKGAGSQVFGISSCLVGKFAGIEFTGRSAVDAAGDVAGGDRILARRLPMMRRSSSPT